MIEMLMTAFILAVGLLGLALFQTMSLRVARGNRSVNTAVLVAQQIVDQAEMEGRLSWLNITDSAYTNGTLAGLAAIKYLNIPNPGNLVETFNSQGGTIVTTSPDPSVNSKFFTATTTLVPANPAVVGNVSTLSVTVTFSDTVTATNAPVVRSVYLSRRIVHG
jgi:Tfp pilus assembly protein PilV